MAKRALLILAISICNEGLFADAPDNQSLVVQGAYLARIGGCADCHTPNPDQPMAGGYGLVTPVGTFYSPNITPDPTTGIGKWSAADFRQALRWGITPLGQPLYPAFPYRSYSKMTDDDINKIFAYLRALPPVRQLNREHELNTFFRQRWPVYLWDQLFFFGQSRDVQENIKVGQGPFEPDLNRSPEWNRGAYLVEAVLHCAECHTPRNFMQVPLANEWMAGSDIAFSGLHPPNITRDSSTGLATWTKDSWITFLQSGFTPQLHSPKGEMAQVIQNTSALTDSDRRAVAEYMIHLPPVKRQEAK